MRDTITDGSPTAGEGLTACSEKTSSGTRRLGSQTFWKPLNRASLTSTTKQRLDELEAREEATEHQHSGRRAARKPVLTREWIRFWLRKNSAKFDVGSTEHQEQ